MRKTRLFMSAFIVFVILGSLCPTAFAKPKDSEIPPPPPTDSWNYPVAEPISVSTTEPRYGPVIKQTIVSPSRGGSHLPPPTPGYYYAGADTNNMETDGIRAKISVTDPLVPHDPDSDEFFAAWILVCDDYGDTWFQVGWIEAAWKDDRQYIFVQHWGGSPIKWTVYYDQFPISEGMSILVALTHSNAAWSAWLYWNSAWVKLVTREQIFSRAPETQQYGEVLLTGAHWIIIPNTAFKDVYLNINNVYQLWDTTFPTETYYRPIYYAHWNIKYYDWYIYWGRA